MPDLTCWCTSSLILSRKTLFAYTSGYSTFSSISPSILSGSFSAVSSDALNSSRKTRFDSAKMSRRWGFSSFSVNETLGSLSNFFTHASKLATFRAIYAAPIIARSARSVGSTPKLKVVPLSLLSFRRCSAICSNLRATDSVLVIGPSSSSKDSSVSSLTLASFSATALSTSTAASASTPASVAFSA